MTKQEFLAELEERLRAEGADALVSENLNYYSSYIDSETAKGRSEDEVIEELGGPNAIAHSVLDAAGYQVDGIPDSIENGRTDSAGNSSSGYESSGTSGGSSYDSGRETRQNPSDGFGTALRIIIGVVIAVLILYLCIVFVGYFWPVILIIVLITLLYRLFQGR